MWKTADFSFLITIAPLINYVYWMRAFRRYPWILIENFTYSKNTLFLCFPLFHPSCSAFLAITHFISSPDSQNLKTRREQVKYFSEVAVVWEEISQFIIQMGWDLLEIYCWHLPKYVSRRKSFRLIFSHTSSGVKFLFASDFEKV